MSAGKVYLVGAGPGDPELITCKGRRLLESADAVLHDHLANEDLLRLAPESAERIYVGKKKSDHAFSQDVIAAMMIERARAGKTVVRLKGGDPFIFGRGGEEVEALANAGVAFQVVPGVTSPLGIAAYTGVPLTHREHTSVVTFVTGHEPDRIDWARLAAAETIVVFMGLTTIGRIADALVAAGRAPSTPAMAVRWGTRPNQQTISATLATLPDAVTAARMKPPATVVIGEVVALRERLDWFERLPLFGQRVVITRPREQASTLASELRALGADAVELPVIAIEPTEDPGPLDSAIARLDSYDWLVFTSANAVRHFAARLDASAVDLRRLRARICAIGPATAAAVKELHLKIDLTPDQAVAESVAEAFAPFPLAGTRVLFPRAAAARDVIPKSLSLRGAVVDSVEAYRNVVPSGAPQQALSVFTEAKPDWVLFTSSSTVKNLLSMVPGEFLAGVRLASIGPATTATMRQHGLEPAVEADPHTADGLLAALLGAQFSP